MRYKVAQGFIPNPEKRRGQRSFEICAPLTPASNGRRGMSRDFETQVRIALEQGFKPLPMSIAVTIKGDGGHIWAAQAFEKPAESGSSIPAVEYKLVASEQQSEMSADFFSEVAKALEDGWDFLGGLASVEDRAIWGICLAQAFIRHRDSE